MAEVNLSSEQLNKLKAAMARAKGLDPAAVQQAPAGRPAAAAVETKAEPKMAAETAVAVENTSNGVEAGRRHLSADRRGRDGGVALPLTAGRGTDIYEA